MSDISDRLLAEIERKGYSYGELARLTGIPKSAIQRYATGETGKIPMDRIESLAKALNVTPEYIMGWENKKEPTVLSAGEPNKDSIELFNMISMLSDDQRRMIIAQVQGILQFQKSQDDQ